MNTELAKIAYEQATEPFGTKRSVSAGTCRAWNMLGGDIQQALIAKAVLSIMLSWTPRFDGAPAQVPVTDIHELIKMAYAHNSKT